MSSIPPTLTATSHQFRRHKTGKTVSKLVIADGKLIRLMGRPVLNQPGALALLDVGAGLPLKDDAVDTAGPQQRRGGQPGHAAPTIATVVDSRSGAFMTCA